MRFEQVRIESMGAVVPPKAFSSVAIEVQLATLYKRLKLPEGRLELMTGIRERHFWDGPKQPSEAAAEAGEKALEESEFDRKDIDLLIHCGVCRDRLEPATAAYVHEILGLNSHCQIMDVSNACLGFLNGMVLAASMIESGQVRRALLVSGENGKPLLEHTLKTLLKGNLTRKSIKPYFANLTIGAGAVAYVLGHKDDVRADAPSLIGGIVETDTSANRLCQGDHSGASGLSMLTDAELLLEAGLKVASRGWDRFSHLLGWSRESIDRIICHQVGRTHQRRLLETLKLDLSKDFSTFETLGNVGSVSLPITFARAVHQGIVKRGDRVAMLGIGSGLSAMMLGVEA